MNGPEPLSIPDFFTTQWYREQKELKKVDHEIAEMLFISKPLLDKWKRKIGWVSGEGRKFCGRKRSDTQRIKELRAGGLTHKEIAAILCISDVTVYNHLKNRV